MLIAGGRAGPSLPGHNWDEAGTNQNKDRHIIAWLNISVYHYGHITHKTCNKCLSQKGGEEGKEGACPGMSRNVTAPEYPQ